jgi:hypothetical protein
MKWGSFYLPIMRVENLFFQEATMGFGLSKLSIMNEGFADPFLPKTGYLVSK